MHAQHALASLVNRHAMTPFSVKLMPGTVLQPQQVRDIRQASKLRCELQRGVSTGVL